MKTLLYIAIIMALLVVVGGITLAILSHQPPKFGLIDNHFIPCRTAPNCVSSEADPTDTIHYTAPIQTHDPQAWHKLTAAITAMGGVMVSYEQNYLHATFTSPLMRYVDDMEARIDRENNIIHWRSSSRVGHSDFGANRKRISQLRRVVLSQ